MLQTGFDLNLVRVFDAIYDTRSVSKAAERLGMGQPAVSAALARLRQTFDDALFVRAAGAMQPTPRALRLASHVSAALAELRSAMIDAPFKATVAERIFTIASTDYTTLVLIPALMAAIEGEAPNVDLRVVGYDKGDIPELIDRNVIDLALGVFQKPPANAVRRFLCPEHFVGLARADHPLLAHGAMSLESYIAARHALVSVRRDATGEIDAALAARGLARRIGLTVSHMLALPAILTGSDLLAAVPSRVAAIAAGPGLRTFAIPLELRTWRIEMVWNPATRVDQASRWLRSKIIAAAAAVSDQHSVFGL